MTVDNCAGCGSVCVCREGCSAAAWRAVFWLFVLTILAICPFVSSALNFATMMDDDLLLQLRLDALLH